MLNRLLNHNHKVFTLSSYFFVFTLLYFTFFLRKIPYNYFGKVWHEHCCCNFLQLAAKRNWATLIPIINSWPVCLDATECQATDICTVVHHLNSFFLSFVPIFLSYSIFRSRRPAFSHSHLLPLTFCLPGSLLAPFLFFSSSATVSHHCPFL